MEDSNDRTVIDPVCGEKLRDDDAVASAEHNGRTYSFKHIKCKMLFERDPIQYLDARGEPTVTPKRGQMASTARVTASAGRNNRAVLVGVGLGVLVLGIVGYWIAASRPQQENIAPEGPTAGDPPTKSAASPPAIDTSDPPSTQRAPSADNNHHGIDEQALAQLERGRELLEAGDHQGAAAAFMACLVKDDRCSSAHAALGALQLSQGKNEEAMQSFLAYLQAAPDNENAADVRALLATAEKKTKTGSVLPIMPKDGNYKVQLGDSLTTMAQGFYGDAMLYPAIIESNSRLISSTSDLRAGMILKIPNKPTGNKARAYRATAQRRPAGAENFEGDPKRELELGNEHLTAGKTELAVHSFRRAVLLDPNFAEAQLALGLACRKLGWHKAAAQAFLAYLRLAPNADETRRVRTLLQADTK